MSLFDVIKYPVPEGDYHMIAANIPVDMRIAFYNHHEYLKVGSQPTIEEAIAAVDKNRELLRRIIREWEEPDDNL